MNSLIWNFIEVNSIIFVLAVAFYLVRDKISFTQQRRFLVGIPFIAIAVIWIKSSFEIVNYQIPLIQLEPIGLADMDLNGTRSGYTNYITLENAYWLGFVVVAILLITRLGKILYFFVKNSSEKADIFRIYQVKGRESFSFFNQIQISPDLSEEQQQIVFEHEKIHVQKKHSFDLLVFELFHMLFWFNPMFIAMKKELVDIHEYEVDQKMYDKHQVQYMEFLVNHAFQVEETPFSLSHQFFNHSTLKKRILNMKKNHKRKTWLLMVIPLIAILATVTQCTKAEVEEVLEDPLESEIVYAEVDEYPTFEGGDEGMINFIMEEVIYPEEAKEASAEGTVYVGFVVSKTGVLKDFEIRKGVHPALDAEALRVVSKMPKWNPGKMDGKEVAVSFTLPIAFRLN